MCEYLLSKF
uniref:Uncharacterized protein n=1 Tax=Arundo donax TaxID=35708 RepID=A0A0A9BK21_ARUDO